MNISKEKYQILCCDDEKYILDNLIKIISDYFTERNISFKITAYSNTEKLCHSILDYDIAFLDIEIKPYSGIKVAEFIRISNKDCKIIFLTNYQDFRNHAFKVHAFGYLTKPVNNNDIYQILDDATIYYTNVSFPFLLTTGVIQLAHNDIFYFEYASRKTFIITVFGIFQTKDNLKHLYEKVKAFNFVYSHKAFIVNLDKIVLINGYNIKLENGNTIPLAQKKAPKFKQDFYHYLHIRRG